MRLYEYVFTGDPQDQLVRWSRAMDDLGRDELVFQVVTVRPEGLTVLDVCPSEADFEGWVNGDDWRRVKAEIGGQVEIRPLGEVKAAIARDGLVETTRPRARAG